MTTLPTILHSLLIAIVMCNSRSVAFQITTIPSTAKTTTTTATISSLYAASGSMIDTSSMWNRGLNFGKGNFKFYDGFDKFMNVFPKEDKELYPEVFNLPLGVYEVRLEKPLGIVFEELDTRVGLVVKDIVDGGNAAIDGTILVGDILIGISAVKVVGAKYERRLIPARKFDFDTMVGAVQSNDSRYNCYDVYLMLEQPGIANQQQVDQFMTFFEPPFDNPWKQQQ
jgi:hypothetical protein